MELDPASRALGMMEIMRNIDDASIRYELRKVGKMMGENQDIMRMFVNEEHSVPAAGVALIGEVLERETIRKLSEVEKRLVRS